MTTEPDIGYMCRVAYECELGWTSVAIYSSEEALRRAHTCADDCGIVEVEVRLVRVMSEGKKYDE